MKEIITIFLISVLFISQAFAATPFFANDAFTVNGIEWCEENFSLYQILENDFFVHHNHSIEARVCANLYDDPLWNYFGPDRYERLIEKSRFFVQLEISESAREAKTGVIDPTPAGSIEVNLSEQMQVVSEDESDIILEKTEHDNNNQNGGGCLIATATYGSELSPQVQILRELRDNTILNTSSGSAFLKQFNQFYYLFSPSISDFERENPFFKETVKFTITPLLTTLTILDMVEINSEEEMLGYGVGIIFLNVGIYFIAPTLIISRLNHTLKNLILK